MSVFTGINPKVGVELGRQKTWNQHHSVCMSNITQNLELQLLLVNIVSNIYTNNSKGGLTNRNRPLLILQQATKAECSKVEDRFTFTVVLNLITADIGPDVCTLWRGYRLWQGWH